MTDVVLSAVRHLVREDGPFASALAQTGPTPTAIKRAFETIDADVRPSSQPGEGAVQRLELMLRARLQEGLRRGEVAAGLDIADLSIFYANVAVSLVAEALGGGDPERLSAIRRVALRILTQDAAVSA